MAVVRSVKKPQPPNNPLICMGWERRVGQTKVAVVRSLAPRRDKWERRVGGAKVAVVRSLTSRRDRWVVETLVA